MDEADGAAFLHVEDLCRSFGRTRVLRNVSFSLERGSVMSLFGPNGAGKTTLLRVLAGALRPHQGAVLLDGRDRNSWGEDWSRRVGVVSHRSYLYDDLTVTENLRLYATLFALDDVEDRIRHRLEEADLRDRRDQRVGELSRGLRQRLAIARALLHDPQLLLLDEPYAGLDVRAAARLRDTLGGLRDGRRTVILVTHNLHEGRRLADRLNVLSGGRMSELVDSPDDPHAFEALYHRTVEAGA